MKKIIVAGLIVVGSLFASKETNAQVQVNINIGQQPLWGPVGYDYVQYYYIPELNVYYDVINGMYIYPQRNRWIHAVALPPRFGHFDLFRLHKVVINQMNPFRYNHQHMRSYGHYKGRYNQMAIRDSREHRYYANPHHPRHREYQSYRQPNNQQHNRPVQGGPRNNDRIANRPQQRRQDDYRGQRQQQSRPAQNHRGPQQDNRVSSRPQVQNRERAQQQRAPQQRAQRAPQQNVQQRQYVERRQSDRGNNSSRQGNRQAQERGNNGRR